MVEKQLIIIGAGPAGMAAAVEAKRCGISDLIVIERERKPGGILNQCIHDGFGLIRYNEVLTGPEYANRAIKEVEENNIEILTDAMVVSMTTNKVLTVISSRGLIRFKVNAVILATGCRERTRGAIAIPGTRPAGIYTAGVVQNLINIRNIMPGKDIVILGSGDIGLIMARRLTLEGARVHAVIELQANSGGLERNISQCLYDYNIPLFLSHTVTRINGSKRVESVTMMQVDQNGEIIPETEKNILCDTLVLSVGLIPENEIAKSAGIKMNEATSSPITDKFLQTSMKGVFVCGNARKVLDLADFVSEEGKMVGRNAVSYIKGKELDPIQTNYINMLKKGVPPKNTITCIVCPQGCHINHKFEQDGSLVLDGNRCPRGAEYAKQEILEPKRVLTTTVKGKNGILIPVKTKEPLPKKHLRDSVIRLSERVGLCLNVVTGSIIDSDELYGEIVSTDNNWRSEDEEN